MKNFNLKCIALSILVLAFSAKSSFTQQPPDLIIGEPDVYQDYILLNPDADSSIVRWQVLISRLYYDTVSQSVENELLAKLSTRKLESYIRLDPFYRSNYEYLRVVVKGLDDNNSPIVKDNWTKSVPTDYINNVPFCLNTCVGKTYAFDVVINERVDLYGNVLSGHTVSFRQHRIAQEDGVNIPEYRHMSFNEATTLDNNSFSQCADDLTETYCHYNINSFNSPS